MSAHFIAGYVMAALLGARLVWGLIGPQTARFTSFIYGPTAILAYARQLAVRQPSNRRGHNPLGGVFVVAMLVTLSLQVITGLFADPEDYFNTGPLAGYISIEMSRKALTLHHTLMPVLIGLVVIHLAAIAFYRIWKRENLIRPMITGRRQG